jgi:HSP20 family protein
MAESSNVPARTGGWGVFGDEFDNLFEGFFRPLSPRSATGANMPAVDVKENDKAYVIQAELPGIKKEDISVTVQDGVLTISGESRSETKEEKEGRVIRQERRYGKFVRSMRLGTAADESGMKAAYKDGILEVTVPKAKQPEPKKISVDVG